MKGKKIYQHRGYLITPDDNGWYIHDLDKPTKTITGALNYIDKIIGGTATAKIPKRWKTANNSKDIQV